MSSQHVSQAFCHHGLADKDTSCPKVAGNTLRQLVCMGWGGKWVGMVAHASFCLSSFEKAGIEGGVDLGKAPCRFLCVHSQVVSREARKVFLE